MLEEIEERAARRESFAFETTLSGRIWARKIPVWGACGYSVRSIFLSFPRVEIAIDRVARRASEGGHDIPEPVIRRRFAAGREDFESIYRPLVDAWRLYDVSAEMPRLLGEGCR